MRKKIKISFLLLLSFIGLVFVSCELQEEAIHQHEHNSNLKLYEMKFEELMTNKKFVNSFSKLPKSKRSITNATFGRTVMENEYGFTIANKPAKVIENNGVTSYTFLITRDSTSSESFENLVIQTDSLNTTKAVIIKYNLTSPITTTEDNSYSFSSNNEITPIVYNNTQVSESSKMIIICYWITTTYCNYGGSEHIAGANCTASYMYTNSTYHCTAGDDGTMDDIPSGGGSDGGGGGGSTTSTGSNYDGSDTSIHGNGSNSINTAPVLDENAPIDHVAELKKLTNNKKDGTKTNIKLKIDELLSRLENTGSTTTTEEDGAMFDSNQNSLPPNQTGGYFTKWYGYGPEYHITLHMHQNKYWDLTATPAPVLKLTNPVPSDKDTYNLLLNFDFTNNPNSTSIIVSRLGVFALRIENQSNADNSYNQLTNNPDEIRRFQIEYDDLIMTPLGLIPSDENLALQGYISLINNYQINGENLGLVIYQAVFDSNGNIINWIKL